MSNPQTLKGTPFGPFHQFRIDLVLNEDGTVTAIGYDAGQASDAEKAKEFQRVEVPPTAFEMIQATKQRALAVCRGMVEGSPEWAEAVRLED